MRWLFAFGWFPVPVFYVRFSWMIGGFTWPFLPWPFILMYPELRTDEGLHRHELVAHVEQALKMGLLPYCLLWLFSRRFRMWSEVRGYQEQFKHPGRNGGPPLPLEMAAKYLSEDYALDITRNEARAALRNLNTTF